MGKKYFFGIAVLAVFVIAIGFSAAIPFGQGINANNGLAGKKAYTMGENHEKSDVLKAIENEDYPAWKTAMEEKMAKIAEGINEENFGVLVEKHNERARIKEEMKLAKESGDFKGMRIRNGLEKPCRMLLQD